MNFTQISDTTDRYIGEFTKLFGLDGRTVKRVDSHDGGRNIVFLCADSEDVKVLRVSYTSDRKYWDYLAETEFVSYLAKGGARVANVIPSKNGELVETFKADGVIFYLSLFEYAAGISIANNFYRYREGVPLSEYFYNCGKTLGGIHALSKSYKPRYRRYSFFDKYTADFIDKILPKQLKYLKPRLLTLTDGFSALERTQDNFGIVHFDYSDGNYHINYSNGDITAFDFDDCCEFFYIYDLANLWKHGVGWICRESDPEKRRKFMDGYMREIVKGYRSETDISDTELLNRLQMFFDAVSMEGILNEFEVAFNSGEEVEIDSELAYSIKCLEDSLPFFGFFSDLYDCESPFCLPEIN